MASHEGEVIIHECGFEHEDKIRSGLASYHQRKTQRWRAGSASHHQRSVGHEEQRQGDTKVKESAAKKQ